MVKFKFYILILIILSLSCKLSAQDNQIEAKKNELSKLKEEISQLENQFAQKSKSEKKSLADYENISKQSFLLNKLIGQLRKEENQKQKEINNLLEEINLIETEIKQLKKNYEKYVIASYKYGNYSEWESVFDASSFQQAVIRLEYLKRFSAKRQKDLIKFQKNKNDLLIAKEKLEKEKEEKKILTTQKESEEKILKIKLAEKKNIIDAIKKDKSKLAKSVAEKRKSEQKIKDLISKLVEEAERKREEELKKSESNESKNNFTKRETSESDYNLDLSTSNFSSFAELKGNLIMPVAKGRIVRKFGETLNPKLKTITVNYGVDIRVTGNLNVVSVAEGVVSTVEWLPGYGTVLIVSHKGNYRTVYGHLSEVYVNEGDRLKTGALIGKVGESLEGNILHFELWNARQYIDPENWLKK